MNLNRLFTTLFRMVLRSAANTGLDVATRGGKPAEDMTPEERNQARANRKTTKQAQKALRMGRRSFR